MDLVKYTETIISSLVSSKDSLAVKEFPSESARELVIQVLVSKDDMPKLIGKGGKTINAIRTLVQAASYKQENKIIKINVDSI